VEHLVTSLVWIGNMLVAPSNLYNNNNTKTLLEPDSLRNVSGLFTRFERSPNSCTTLGPFSFILLMFALFFCHPVPEFPRVVFRFLDLGSGACLLSSSSSAGFKTWLSMYLYLNRAHDAAQLCFRLLLSVFWGFWFKL